MRQAQENDLKKKESRQTLLTKEGRKTGEDEETGERPKANDGDWKL